MNELLTLLQAKLDEAKSKGNINSDIKRIESQINKLKIQAEIDPKAISNLVKQLEGVLNQKINITNINVDVQNAQKAGEQIGNNIAQGVGKGVDKATKQLNKVQLSIDNGTYDAKIADLTNKTKQWTNANGEARISVKSLNDAYSELLNSKTDEDKIANAKKLDDAIKETANSVRKMNAELAKDSQIGSLHQRIQEFYDKNTATHRRWGNQLKDILSKTSSEAQITRAELDKIEQEFLQIGNSARQSGKLGDSFFGGIKKQASSFLQWVSISGIIMDGVHKIKQSSDELKELDNILTEISKTSDLTAQQLQKLGNVSFESASEFGKKASEYLTGVQEMYRAGFDNAEEMAKLSVLAQSAGDMEATASNDYLLATNAAYDFKGSVEQLTDVLNRQNFITNNAAVSMQDMADATSQAASIASQYGVEVDELSALIGVAVSKTRKSGAEVGTALKSIFANLQDTTSRPIVSAFNAVGVSMTKIVNGAETLKTPIELLEELSVAYNSLPEGDARRANILTDIGSKYHSNVLSSILGDYESLNEMLDLYHSNLADGSAYKEAMKSANNWEGSLNKLSNSFTDLVQNFIDSDEVIGAINLVNGLVKGIDKLTESVGILGTVGVGAMGFLGAKGHGLTNCVTIS